MKQERLYCFLLDTALSYSNLNHTLIVRSKGNDKEAQQEVMEDIGSRVGSS